MLKIKGRKTFKCKQCGYTFEAFDTEGGIMAGPNLPHCPKCGSRETRKAHSLINWGRIIVSNNFRNDSISVFKIFMLYILTITFTSCGTPRIIKEHIAADDIPSLIDDYNGQKSKHQKRISEYIFTSHNFSTDSYGTLLYYQGKSIDDIMKSKFDTVIKHREDSILSVLDNYKQINSIASYYKLHEDEQIFLRPIVAGTLTQNIADYEYKDVRSIYREFKDTDLKDSIYPYYVVKREEAMPQAISVVEAYCKNEMKIFEIYRKEGRGRIPKVSANAFEKVIDNLLDNDIPSDQKRLTTLYKTITGKYNPITAIKDVVKDETGKMMKDMNECRNDLVKELTDYPISNKHKVPTIPISVKKVDVKCPLNEFKAIENLQNQQANRKSKVSTLLSIASWIPNIIGDIASVADIYKTYKDTKKNAEEVSPLIQKMAKAVFVNFNKACQTEYDNSFKTVKQSIQNSHNKLKQAIYEDF